MKVVTLMSGGLDSAVLAYYLVLICKEQVFPLTIDYGQRHTREIHCSREICLQLGLKFKTLEVPELGKILPSSLTDPLQKIPEQEYSEEGMRSTNVPNRNMILISLAAGYAMGIGAPVVAYAAHAGDHVGYPDCRPEFVHSLGATLRLAGWEPIELRTPFVELRKSSLVLLGKRLGVPFELTWSCYKGGVRHCGVCSTCRERRAAFLEASVPDPTEYTS